MRFRSVGKKLPVKTRNLSSHKVISSVILKSRMYDQFLSANQRGVILLSFTCNEIK